MTEIDIRSKGRVGRITLTRPDALNALTYSMCGEIERAIDQWNKIRSVDLIVIDAAGRRAFCAGGDIVEMHRSAMAGDLEYGRRFWCDEYRLNAKIANSPLPVVSLMQGYTMGGGVGVGCHASHRIIGESSRIAMPECTIGLVPDVGGSFLLSRSPGRIGECMGVTGMRAGPTDATIAGLADHFVPEVAWPDLIDKLLQTGDVEVIGDFACLPPSERKLDDERALIDRVFSLPSMPEIVLALEKESSPFATTCLKSIARNSPLSMSCALMLIRLQRNSISIEQALALEYRYVYRSVEHTDFIEGIRALVIDKDNEPRWMHSGLDCVGKAETDALLAPLGDQELKLETEH